MQNIEVKIARSSLSLFGESGVLRKVATGLDSTYRVRRSDGEIFALRVSSGMPIRCAAAFLIEAGWVEALADNQWFDVPRVHSLCPVSESVKSSTPMAFHVPVLWCRGYQGVVRSNQQCARLDLSDKLQERYISILDYTAPSS